MPVDPNILMQASKAYAIQPQQDPLESYARALTLKNAVGQNALQDLQTKTAQQGLDDDQAVRGAYQSSGGDQAALRANLVTRGLYKQVQALDKAKLEDDAKRAGIQKDKSAASKSDIETAAKHLDITGQVFGFVKDNPTVENANKAVDALLAAGVVDAPAAQNMKLSIPNDPNAIKAAATQNFQNALSAKDQLQKFETRNIGGQTQTVGINPVSGQTGVVNTVQNTQSPDSIASNATTKRGQNMVDARSRETNAASVGKPFEVTDPETGQPTLVRQDKQGNITRVTEFQPKGMGSTKLTEDQGKATGWLVQADNAFKNMKSAVAADPDSANPGVVTSAIASVPLVGETVANSLRGNERQKFMQGASSLSEALLRAATGAGVNKDEARQKVDELTPKLGDSPELRKQKMDSIPLYIESLKVRAGPGARQLPGIVERGSSAAGATKIRGDDGYNMLKSGDRYIGPDGIERVKP